MKPYLTRLFVTLLIINAVFLPVGCTLWIRNIPRRQDFLLMTGLYFYNKNHGTKFKVREGENGAAVINGKASNDAQRKEVIEYAVRFLSANHVEQPKVVDAILVKK